MQRSKLASDGTLLFECPGCDTFHGVPTTPGRPESWGFNGSEEFPTLTPSILVGRMGNTVKRCHSFVRDGKIQFLNDCDHQLKGKTVDLPEWK